MFQEIAGVNQMFLEEVIRLSPEQLPRPHASLVARPLGPVDLASSGLLLLTNIPALRKLGGLEKKNGQNQLFFTGQTQPHIECNDQSKGIEAEKTRI